MNVCQDNSDNMIFLLFRNILVFLLQNHNQSERFFRFSHPTRYELFCIFPTGIRWKNIVRSLKEDYWRCLDSVLWNTSHLLFCIVRRCSGFIRSFPFSVIFMLGPLSHFFRHPQYESVLSSFSFSSATWRRSLFLRTRSSCANMDYFFSLVLEGYFSFHHTILFSFANIFYSFCFL